MTIREQIEKNVHDYYQALLFDDYPRDGLTTHFGVGFSLDKYYIRISEYHRYYLLITCYAKRYYLSRRTHQRNKKAITRAIPCIIFKTWNGLDGHNGISIVFDCPVPNSLKTAINNYYKLSNPLRKTPQQEERYKKWSKWFMSKLEVVQSS